MSIATPEQTAKRIADIREHLTAAFHPTYLEIKDEGDQHRHHAGAQTGKSHLCIRISSPMFQGHSRVTYHRWIYEALGGMMETDIHALRIQIT